MALRVAHIVHWPKSGIGTVVRQLIENDGSGNFDYLVIFLESDPKSESIFSQLGATVIGVSISNNPIAAIKKIFGYLRKADIVHVHSFLPQLISFFASTKKSKKVRTIHNPYPYLSATDWRSKIKRSIEGFLIFLSGADLIAVSEDTLRSLPWPTPRKAIAAVIENGVAVNPPRELNDANASIERPDGFLFVTLGRIEHQKGFDLLINAMAILKTKLPNFPTPIHLWIIGEGGCRCSLEEQVKSLQLENITFVGYQIEPANYLIMGDVFVLPSRFEGFALAAVEAMALGLPVILSEFGGIASRLSHGKNAHITPRENAEQLASALILLLEHPEYRKTLAVNGKKFVDSNFSIALCASKYSAVYLRPH